MVNLGNNKSRPCSIYIKERKEKNKKQEMNVFFFFWKYTMTVYNTVIGEIVCVQYVIFCFDFCKCGIYGIKGVQRHLVTNNSSTIHERNLAQGNDNIPIPEEASHFVV